MRHPPLAVLILAAAALLAGCSQKARNESSEAANAIAADVNATSAQAVSDTTNALDAAGNETSNGLDAAGNAANVTDTAKNAAATPVDGSDDPVGATNAAEPVHHKE